MQRGLPRHLRGFLVLGALAALALAASRGVWAGDDSKEKVAPPDKDAVAKSTELIKGLYKDELKKAEEDAAAAKELVATLLKEGRDTKDDMALKFAAYSLARDVAARAGDHTAALEAIDELSKAFKIDTSAMKSAA